MSARTNLIKIGWDIGGAHIKYCVESKHLILFGMILSILIFGKITQN